MKKRFLLVVPFAVLVIGLAVVVGRAAAQGDGSGLIVICIRSNGTIRPVPGPGQCNTTSRNPRFREQELSWNEQHPVLALFGSNVVDLSGLSGTDREIRFDNAGASIFRLTTPTDQYVFNVNAGQVLTTEDGKLTTYHTADTGEGFFEVQRHTEPDGTSALYLGRSLEALLEVPDEGDQWIIRNKAGTPVLTLQDNLIDFSGMTGAATIGFPGPASMHVEPESAPTENIMTWEWDAPEFENNKFAIRSKHPSGTGAYTQNEFHFRHDGMDIFSDGVAFHTGPDEAIELSVGNGIVDTSNSDLSLQIYDCSDDIAPEIVTGTFGFCFDSSTGISYMIAKVNGQVLRMDMFLNFAPFPSP